MNFLDSLVAICLIHALAVASPGPDLALVIRSSIVSRRSGLFASGGIAFGNGIHVVGAILLGSVATNLGLGWLVGIQVMGALYLIYLAIQSFRSALRSRQNFTASEVIAGAGRLLGFRSGLLTTVTNGKAAAYFLGVVSQFLTPETATANLVAIGIALVLITLAWFSAVTLVVSRIRRYKRTTNHSWILDTILGCIFLVLGVSTLATALS